MCVCVCVCVCGWVCVGGYVYVCMRVYTQLSKTWKNTLSSLKARKGRLPLQAAGGGRTKIDHYHGKDSPGLDLHSQPAFWSLYLTFVCTALGEEAVRTQGEVYSPSSVLMKEAATWGLPKY